jgi:recombination protein RecR
MGPLDALIEAFRALPGVGRKTATRYAFHILRAEPEAVRALADALVAVKEGLRPCSVCRCFADADPCALCADPRRDPAQLCVVEDTRDVLLLERLGGFRGRYHVLGGLLAPLKGVRPEHLAVEGLLGRLEDGGVAEVILALSPTVEGLTTARFLENLLRGKGVKVSELARGLAMGTDLEYADEATLAMALEGRTTVQT